MVNVEDDILGKVIRRETRLEANGYNMTRGTLYLYMMTHPAAFVGKVIRRKPIFNTAIFYQLPTTLLTIPTSGAFQVSNVRPHKDHQ